MISVGKRPSGYVCSFHILLKMNKLLNLRDGFVFGHEKSNSPRWDRWPLHEHKGGVQRGVAPLALGFQ